MAADTEPKGLKVVPAPEIEALPTEVVPIDSLRAHPRNYRAHPPDQLAHLEASLREHGLYRNVVVARDDTILAGHGVWMAAQGAGVKSIEIKRADVDPDDPSAIRLLTGDNEIARLVDVDQRALAELLEPLKAEPSDLLGTGFDESQVAELLAVSGIAGERQSEFLDDLIEPGSTATHVSEGGHLERVSRTPRQLTVVASEDERTEIVGLLKQIRELHESPTLAAALLWALRECLAHAS